MRTLVRPTYPTEINIIILVSLFMLSSFFSYEMFNVRFHNPGHLENAALGMCLIGVAVVLAILIMWEEILFHIKVKEIKGGLIFRNQRKKLKTQLLLFAGIPVIFWFIYQEYDLIVHHFIIWAVICIGLPALEIIVSGISSRRNYLKLTSRMIKYKNNSKEESFETKDIRNIMIIRGEKRFIKKIQLLFTNNDHVTIDLEEMHLHPFYDSIQRFINTHYKHLVTEPTATNIAS
ncbi:MAG TPA: hypothetical protein VNB90_05865 [Cytophagaceae bacterium]|nr:hypothetical protein [Cytophagaceae bacterium]